MSDSFVIVLASVPNKNTSTVYPNISILLAMILMRELACVNKRPMETAVQLNTL